MNHRKISIVVSIYNSEEYLEECINSIINQTYKNLEIILIDDGSTDNSIKIAKMYELLDKRIKLLIQKNSGVSAARNLGIKNSTGEFLTFVDSDDWIDLDMYEKMISKINNNYDSVICSFQKEYENRIEYEELLFRKEEVLCGEDMYNKLLLNMISRLDKNENTIMGAVWRCIFKREIVSKNNILFDTEMSFAEDLIFCLRYFKNCNEIYIYNEHLYHYRFNNKSIINSYNENLWEKHLLINKKIYEIFDGNINLKLKERLNLRLLFASINSIFNILHEDNKESILAKYNEVKIILNHREMEELRKNYVIKNNKYKIFKYNRPLLTYSIISIKNTYNKIKKNI